MNAAFTLTAAAPNRTAEPELRTPLERCASLSDSARQRMEQLPGEPLFLADWLDVTMLHFEVDPERLQRLTPFRVDRFDGRAFVTLVAFRMERMRLRRWPKLTATLFRPWTESRFLNLRTYVRHEDEPGIEFLAEWLSNRLSVRLGPITYGLPYREGALKFGDQDGTIDLQASPTLGNGGLQASLETTGPTTSCEAGSIDEFLMERYTAFTHCDGRRRRFHIWHRPWPQTRCRVRRLEASLIAGAFGDLADARFLFANHSVGVRGVWMSRPFKL